MNQIRKDELDENYILLDLEIKGKKLTLGSVYGPNENNVQFYRKLKREVNCGGSAFIMKYDDMVILAMGLVYPLSEHVDIFPVRLVSTFHRVFSVYLTLAIYLT